jgi:predicted nucleic acid-binding protein
VGLTSLASGTWVYLDTNVWIYALEGYAAYAPVLKGLLERIDRADLLAVTSELALAKALVKPLSENKAHLQRLYEEALQSADGLTVVPITREILVEAASLRAHHPVLKLPDAIHAATALALNCSHFLTNDRRFADVPGLTVVSLAELRSE